MGVKEPPTISDMENEFTRLSKEINLDQIPSSGHYTDRKPKEKTKSNKIWLIGGIVLVIVIGTVGGSIWYFSSDSESDDQKENDVSISSKES